MRIPRCYTDQSLVVGDTVELGEKTAHYLGRVLRLSIGSALVLFNGRGGEYQGNIASIGKKSLVVTVQSFVDVERESGLAIQLGIGISRGDKFDWVVQKATELGVATITPLITERGEIRLKGEKAEKKIQHWQQIAISACEQCQRNRVPTIQPVQTVSEWQHGVAAELKLVLHHRAVHSLTEYAIAPTAIALLVGAEGGLTEAEIEQAMQHGFQPMVMGPRVLRTETAPVVACTLLQAQWGDLR